jgi:hypothetical protein
MNTIAYLAEIYFPVLKFTAKDGLTKAETRMAIKTNAT